MKPLAVAVSNGHDAIVRLLQRGLRRLRLYIPYLGKNPSETLQYYELAGYGGPGAGWLYCQSATRGTSDSTRSLDDSVGEIHLMVQTQSTVR
jgi:hypothetical protein